MKRTGLARYQWYTRTVICRAKPAFLLAVVLLLAPQALSAQVCRLSVAGLNRSRRVMGAVHAECPESVVHTPPFGNWGVTSNFGVKHDSHQFDGWCHDTHICDNLGRCFNNCKDGWYEWNSCTDIDLYKPPNCTLYNAKDCTEQATSTGVNVHGTQLVDIPVKCPSDSDGDGVPDQGGCKQLGVFSPGTNFMSLYELDPGGPDDLVQTVYFPPTPVPLICDVWGCAPSGSAWVAPSFYDSPSFPPKVYAEMATVVNWGAFVDASGACRLPSSVVNTVSGASFAGPSVAPESIATSFGSGLAPVSAAADTLPLPTSLGSTMIRITDRTGTRRWAPLFFVSSGQVNFLVPAGTAPGAATVQVFRGDSLHASGTLQIEPVSPALFTANANGKGVASALVVRTKPDATQTVQPVFECAASGGCIPIPIDLGPPSDRLSLILFGTGIRGRTALSAVTVLLAGETSEVSYAGAQGQFVGLDQVNVTLPRSLLGRGDVDVVLKVDSRPSNIVTVNIR